MEQNEQQKEETKDYPNYTRNAWAGEKYKVTKGMSTAQIAKLIRSELKEKFPKVKFSIRTQLYAGGSSINVHIKWLPFNPLNPAWNKNDYDLRAAPRYKAECTELLKDVEHIVNQYRYSDSDGMVDYFDTNFYSHVSLDWEYERDLEATK